MFVDTGGPPVIKCVFEHTIRNTCYSVCAKGATGEAMIMLARTIVCIGISTALLTSAGCGKRDDYRERFIKLQEQNRKEIVKLEAMYTAQIDTYKQKLAARERELRARGTELAEAKRRSVEKKIRPAASALSARELGQKKALATAVQPGAQPEGTAETSPTGISAIPGNISMLEQFVSEYENSIAEGRQDKYQKEFGAFLASLRAQAQKEPALQRKERTLGDLRDKIAAETDEDEKEELGNRMEKIKNASGEDLEGILNHYQQLDNNEELGRLMAEYNISRDELSDYGITPPPRTRWGPEIKEITNNLNAFVQDYAPLVPEGQREQYRKDFNDAISNMSTRPTDEQVIQRKNQMMGELEAQLAAAPENEKQRIQRRMQGLEETDLDNLRQRVQMEKARGIRDLSEKYGIPRSELQQSGVMVPRGRRNR